MLSSLILVASTGLLATVHAATTTATGPPVGVYKTAYNVPAVTATTLIGVPLATDVSTATGNSKRDVESGPAKVIKKRSLARRDDTCVAQPSGISYVSSPDDPNTFQKDSYFANAANSAATPSGYTQAFKNIVATNNADNYQGFTFLNTYDVASCASQCDAQANCASFNIYFERDPVLSPDPTNCPNPASLTRIKCVWWGGLVSLNNANNYGQQIASFYVVVAGANGYTNDAKAAKISAAATATSQAATATETAKAGSIWLVYYSADSSQGSYSNAQATSSEADCQVACDADSQCNAYTYVGGANGVGSGTCWLKNALGSPTASNNNVVSGVRAVNPNSGSAASSVTTTSSASLTTTSNTVKSVSSVAAASNTTTAAAVTIDTPSYGSTAGNQNKFISTISYSPGATTAVVSSSTTTTSTTTSSSSTTTTTTTPSPTPTTTLATIVTTSSTTSAAAKATNFVMAVGFASNTNFYAYQDPNFQSGLQYVWGRSSATTFSIDSNGYLHSLTGSTDSVAYVVKKGGDWQQLQFRPVKTALKGDIATCSIQGQLVVCSTPSVGFTYAGGCWFNGAVYFGSPNKVPWGCAWVGLYPQIV